MRARVEGFVDSVSQLHIVVSKATVGVARRLHGRKGCRHNAAAAVVDVWWCRICQLGLGSALLPCVLALVEARRPRLPAGHRSPLYLLYKSYLPPPLSAPSLSLYLFPLSLSFSISTLSPPLLAQPQFLRIVPLNPIGLLGSVQWNKILIRVGKFATCSRL